MQLAKKHGYKIELIKAVEFKRGEPLKEFVDTFYEEKKMYDGCRKALAKLMLNSLYGKMGERPKTGKTELLSGAELAKVEGAIKCISHKVAENTYLVKYDLLDGIRASDY